MTAAPNAPSPEQLQVLSAINRAAQQIGAVVTHAGALASGCRVYEVTHADKPGHVMSVRIGRTGGYWACGTIDGR